ncbi:hypothetical protein Gotur_026540, partial [Gossypium turneri]
MYEKTLAITQLIETLKFDRVCHHVALPCLKFFLPMYVVASKSSTFALNEIMEALEDDEINMIGVWGIKGVGKTTFFMQRVIKSKNHNFLMMLQWLLCPRLWMLEKFNIQLQTREGK